MSGLPPDDVPLPSEDDEEETEDEATETESPETAPLATAEKPAAPARPPPPTFKLSTFVLAFLGMLGLYMIIDTSARNAIATLLGITPGSNGPLYLLIGFSSTHLLLTMAFAAAIEMLVTAVAYNWTTDWVKAAKVQKWSSAFRKVQMEAVRSGKKDRIAALRPKQEQLTRLSADVSIAQLKGMAVTWFLLIVIYSWVGLVIINAPAAAQTVSLGGAAVNLTHPLFGPVPYWFIIFSLYTVPLSLVFRRVLKHFWLRRYAEDHHVPPTPSPADVAGGAA